MGRQRLTAVLLDTHTWAWTFADTALLSPVARTAIKNADTVYVSPISFFEIGQKVRLGKWPEMEPMVQNLPDILREQGGLTAPFTPEICLHASLLDWEHRDPFDRLLAASAERLGFALITKDPVFGARPALRRIW